MAKWMRWSMAVAVSLAAIAAAALAQDHPVPGPREDAVGDERGVDDLEDLDGLDLLLAADIAPEAGRGAGGPGARGAGMHGGPGMGHELGEKLNLSDDQRTKLADIHDRHERAAIPIHGDLRVASLDLRKLMRADKPDLRTIDAQIDRIASLRASLHKARVAGMLEARAVLTPAQQKLMREHHGRMMGRSMHEGHGRRGGLGMGMRHL